MTKLNQSFFSFQSNFYIPTDACVLETVSIPKEPHSYHEELLPEPYPNHHRNQEDGKLQSTMHEHTEKGLVEHCAQNTIH